MKLGKASWLILSSGIIVVAFASLGMARFQLIGEEDRLKEELALVEKRRSKTQLKELSDRKQELEGQLSQTEAQLQTVKNELDQAVASIDVTDSIFDIAETCSVTITELSSPGKGEEKLGSVACSAIRLDIRATGDVAELISFIVRLNNDFVTGMVESAEISVPEEPEGVPSAGIQFALYAYQGG